MWTFRTVISESRLFWKIAQIHKSISAGSGIKASNMSSGTAQSTGFPAEEDMPYIVGHDKKNNEFYIKFKDDAGNIAEEKAILQYQWVRKGVVDLYHTHVPPTFRSKGMAKVLAKAAFDYVVETNGKMKLSCTYLQDYIEKNPLPQYETRVLR